MIKMQILIQEVGPKFCLSNKYEVTPMFLANGPQFEAPGHEAAFIVLAAFLLGCELLNIFETFTVVSLHKRNNP